MKKLRLRTVKAAICMVACITWSLHAWTANTKTTVRQVTTTVVLDSDVDYTVTSDTPFADGGVVNIVNTDHAVLILADVKPSRALPLLSAHVQVNGNRAVNGQNCQVKLYNRGCIVMPYAAGFKPLTVFSEPDFGGEQCSDFGLENTGGFMNTLTDKKLNNRIRSFKLKRGYMVTFANRAAGRGYSRCFVAADRDLEVAQLPPILDNSISSYRVFKWYDTGKQALANDTRAAAVSALNVTSCYSFGLGEDRGIDCECVPHHIYEDWPSASACGSVTYSPHLKTNNEPGNSADDHPQSVATILANWENLMATGMRLCSPSSHDGSLAHLREFLDSVDARGWRCDIIDLHCYWPENSFNTWSFYDQWVNRYHRPIWISEWVWGASWNSNGAFASGVTEAQNAAAVQRICEKLNSWDYIERYYYWNSERDPSRIYRDGVLTAAGQYYATINSGVGYNGKYDTAPRVPTQRNPDALQVAFDKDAHTAHLTWHDYNGEMNSSIAVERRTGEGQRWNEVAKVKMQEQAADYEYDDTDVQTGYEYRIHIVDGAGKDRYSNEVAAASSEMQAGDAITTDGKTMYIGGNIFTHGDFELDLYSGSDDGWLNGEGLPIAAPFFQVVPVGGVDGGSYLQSYGHGGTNSEASVKTVFDVMPNTDYYFSGASCNDTGVFQQLNLSSDGVSTPSMAALLSNSTANWITQYSVFNTGDYDKAIVALRQLGCQSQTDNLMLARLFDSRDDAIADGVVQARRRAEAVIAHTAPFNGHLRETLEQSTAEDEPTLRRLQQAIDVTVKALRLHQDLLRLSEQAGLLLKSHRLYGYDAVAAVADEVSATLNSWGVYSPQWVIERHAELSAAIDDYLPTVALSGKIRSATFDGTSDGWTVKAGTYQGGDQRLNSKDGKTFWNAWWSGLSSTVGTGQTMAIRQDVGQLDHGLYSIECRASTEHFCLTDQHAYITDGTQTMSTPRLTADYYDLPSVPDSLRWQVLRSMPIYVPDGGSVTIGFEGSKQDARDNMWRRVGDKNSTGDRREGWWCATDFVLRFHPLYRTEVVARQFGAMCLPYAVRAADHLHIYQIAAITSDAASICLEETDEVVAGMPFVYRYEDGEAGDIVETCFYEHGEAVTSAVAAPGNLRGFFKTSARVPNNHYMLVDGTWTKVTGTDRPRMTNYTAVMRPFNDPLSKPMPVVSSWDGPTMPIVGITEAEIEAGVETPLVHGAATDSAHAYDLQGRKLKPGSGKGVTIKNGKKTIR